MSLAAYHWSYGRPGQPLLLCLHGIGSCADAFIPQIPLGPRTGRQVVAWDAPGYRHSPDPEDEPGIDGWADAAAGLIDDLDRGPADVLGVSWGGVTATRLALRHPGRVRSLILANSSVGAGTSPEAAASMRARVDGLTDAGTEPFARDRAPLLVNRQATPELIDSVARLMIDSIRVTPYRWACNSMAEADHRPDLASLAVPTLVITGAEDQVTGPRAAQALADGIPGARLVTIESAGHLANQEHPGAFNEAVAAFLDTVPT